MRRFRKWLSGMLVVFVLLSVLVCIFLNVPAVNKYAVNKALSYVLSEKETDYHLAVESISFRWDGFSLNNFLVLRSHQQDTLLYAKRLDGTAGIKSILSLRKFNLERIDLYDVQIHLDESLADDSVWSINVQDALPSSLKVLSCTRTYVVFKRKLASLLTRVSYMEWKDIHHFQQGSREILSSLIIQSPSVDILSYSRDFASFFTPSETFSGCEDTTSVLGSTFSQAKILLGDEAETKLLLPIYPFNLRINDLAVYNRSATVFSNITRASLDYRPSYAADNKPHLYLTAEANYEERTLRLQIDQQAGAVPTISYDASYAGSYMRAHAGIGEHGKFLILTSVSILLDRDDVSKFVSLDTTLASLWSTPLLFEGDITLSKELLRCQIDSMLLLNNLSVKGSLVYFGCQSRLFIDSMQVNLPADFTKTVYKNYPLYELDTMAYTPQSSKIYVEGNLLHDTLYNILISADSVLLATSDTMWHDIHLNGYSLHLVKDSSTSLKLKANQNVVHLYTPASSYSNVNATYLEDIKEGGYDSLSVAMQKQNGLGNIRLHSLFHRGENGIVKAFVRGVSDRIAVSDFVNVAMFSGLRVKTSFEGDIQWDTDNLGLEVAFYNLLLLKEDRSLVLPQLNVSSQWSQYKAYVEINSGEDYAYARYDRINLRNILYRIAYQYESIFNDEKHQTKPAFSSMAGEYAEVVCRIRSANSWIHLLNLSPLAIGRLDFNMTLANYDIKADVDISQGRYNDYRFSRIHGQWNGSKLEAFLSIGIDSLYDDDEQIVSHLSLDVVTEDRKNIQLSLSGLLADEDEKLDIRGNIHSTSAGNMYLKLDEFDVSMGPSNRWVLADTRATSDVVSQLMGRPAEFTIVNGEQSFSCIPIYYKSQNILDIQMHTDDMDIGILNSFLFEPSFTVGGVAFLDIAIQGRLSKLVASLGGRIMDLSFNGTPFGDVDVYQQYKDQKMQLSVYDRYGEDLRMKSVINFQPTPSYTIFLSAHNQPLSWLDYYVLPSLHSIGGRCSGDVEIRYDDATDVLSINGTANVNDAKAIVSYTTCTYIAEKGLVEFDGQRIFLSDWKINTPERPSLSGQLTLDMEQASSFGLLDMDLELDTDNLKLYDSKIQGQDNYRLHLYAAGGLVIRKRNNLVDIFGNFSVSDSSVFEIRTLGARGDVFDNHQITMRASVQEDDGHKNQPQDYYDVLLQSIEEEEQINFNSEIDINENLRIFFYTDVNSQESINFLGEGHLSVNSYDKETAEIIGDYNVSSIAPFDIGSLSIELDQRFPSSIRWSGDPNPELDVYVRSFVKNVDFSSLYNSVGTFVDDNLNTNVNTNFRELRSDVDLNIHVHGTASNIDPQFDLQLPVSSGLQNSQNVRLFLDGFRSDPQFAKQQVGHLVLFNRLSNRVELAQSEINVNTAIVGALSSITTYVLNESIGADLVQKTIDKVLPGRNIRFNINSNFSTTSSGFTSPTEDQAGSSLIDKGNINLLLSKGFFSDRLVLSVGSAFNYFINATNESVQNTSNTQFYTSPSVDLRWQIAPASNVYLGVYYKNTVDFDNQLVGFSTQQTSNIAGVNIGFQKEVNSFRELFTRDTSVAKDSIRNARKRLLRLAKKK